MKILIVVGVVFAVALGMYRFLWQTPKTEAHQLHARDITNDLAEGALLLDVRSAEEFAQSHATGAINVPLQQLQGGDFGSLQRDQTLYVYCRTGNRSAQAARILEAAGYTNVINIQSLENWQQMGGAVE